MSSSSGPNSDASSQFEVSNKLSIRMDIDVDRISARNDNHSRNEDEDLNQRFLKISIFLQ